MTGVPSILAACLLATALFVVGCDKDETASAPRPQEPTREATTEFCGMDVLGHPGPKGQIFLKSRKAPLWFSSARDAIAFTLLPEEPRDVAAIYVNDMGRANWDKPEPGTWIEARQAWYVIESSRTGGMGAAETVPFAERSAAENFARQFRGRVVAYENIPHDYVLGGDAAELPDRTGAIPVPPS